MMFLYNLVLPLGILCFLPGVWWKYRHRSGWKATFGERFGRFSPERAEELKAWHGAVWIHAVSVGEAVAALSLIRAWQRRYPERRFVVSTTTTTGQELVRKQAPEGVAAIFCPIDLPRYVRRAFDVVRPAMLAIFETEIWPNLVAEASARKIPLALVNARMSDHSVRGYRRIRGFMAPLLERFSLIAAQSEPDAARFLSIAPKAAVETLGNLKFDQSVPADLKAADFSLYFGPGAVVLLAGSTHPGEEKLIIECWRQLAAAHPELKLVIVPRHTERGDEIAALLTAAGVSFCRRSRGEMPAPGKTVPAVLADTTGEMLALMKGADIVIMGKSLAGQDEGHNLIEPALLDKPIVTGAVLRNFRFVLDVLKQADAVATVPHDEELGAVLEPLVVSADRRRELGARAGAAIRRHAGAVERTIERLDALLP